MTNQMKISLTSNVEVYIRRGWVANVVVRDASVTTSDAGIVRMEAQVRSVVNERYLTVLPINKHCYCPRESNIGIFQPFTCRSEK